MRGCLAHSPDELWQAHRDINDVMLATALAPETFLSIDERMSKSIVMFTESGNHSSLARRPV